MNSPFKPTKSAIAANKYGIARSNLLLSSCSPLSIR